MKGEEGGAAWAQAGDCDMGDSLIAVMRGEPQGIGIRTGFADVDVSHGQPIDLTACDVVSLLTCDNVL